MYSVGDLSSQVNELSRNSTENLLEIGSIFLDAKTHLSKSEYEQFLKETHYVENSSTVRKWERIGGAYLRLKTISNYLPPVFTTLYTLSQLTPDELDVLIKNNILKPSVTSKEINDELNKKTKSIILPKFTVYFNELATEDIVNEVNSFLSNYSTFLVINANDVAQEILI